MKTLPYNDLGNWIRKMFPFRVQKISVDAGFTCPNRDGRLSVHGCTYCDNRTFSPSYCNRNKPIREQIEEGKAFFSRKYPDMKYLAYFQSFTNTYGTVEELRQRYEEALAVEDVVGLVIGTRPDCVDEEKLDYLAGLNKKHFIIVEYGIESANDDTLRRINRGHTFETCKKAIKQTKERGIITGGHIIIGLPGEDQKESLRQAPIISECGLSENTPDADNQRYKTCKRIHGKTVSSVQRGRIHSVNIRIYPTSKQRHYLRTLCKPVAQRTVDCAKMGY